MKTPISLTTADYNLVFANSPAAKLVIATDAPDYTILDVNDAYLDATNTTKEALVGKSVFAVFPGNPSDEDSKNIERTIDSFEQAIHNKAPHTMSHYRYDIPVPGKPGEFEERYWTTTNSPVLDENDEVKFFIHSPLNVTEIVKLTEKERVAVEALRKQREDLLAIFMQAPVGIGIFLGENYVVDLINPPLCELYGKSIEEMLNKPVFDVLTHAKGLGFEQLLDKVRLTDEPFHGEGLAVPLMRNGKVDTTYVDFVYHPFKNAGGITIGVIAVAVEVTNQILTKQELQLSEQRLSLAVNSSALGVWDLDLQTQMIERSPKHAEIFGHDPAQHSIPIDEIWKLIVPEDVAEVQRKFEQSLQTGKFEVEARIIHTDQSVRWVHVNGEIFRSAETAPTRMLGTMQDITARKEQERQKDEFISVVSHELKTPITSLKAFGQLIERRLNESGDTISADMIKKMNTNVSKLTILVQDLVDVTRIENNKLRLRVSSFDFGEMLNDIAEEIMKVYPTHQLNINVAGTIHVQQDREKTEQVVRNLITNAIKYSPDADRVSIEAVIKNEFVKCTVTDFGIGISEQQQKQIFDRFYQASDKTANPFPGLGLGLYISKSIVENQGGILTVNSTPGKGSQFIFTMPVRVQV